MTNPDTHPGEDQRLALADRLAGHLGPFNFVTKEERDLIVAALRGFVEAEAQFLIDRLDEFDPGEADAEREYHGHIAPAIARLRNAINTNAQAKQEPIAWRYQRKEGWEGIWRYSSRPLANQDFESPDDWVVEPLYASSVSSTVCPCAKCGCKTNGEAALVNGEVWCHPCADGVAQGPGWECGARKQGTAGGNAPADCDWPGCGCDPAATSVLDAIEESGFEIVKRNMLIRFPHTNGESY